MPPGSLGCLLDDFLALGRALGMGSLQSFSMTKDPLLMQVAAGLQEAGEGGEYPAEDARVLDL